MNLSNGIHEDSNFSIPKLNYYGKPVIAVLSLGEFTDQYIAEILINKNINRSWSENSSILFTSDKKNY